MASIFQRRFLSLASHNKEIGEGLQGLLARGDGIFLEKSSQERKNEQNFLVLLLSYIETWKHPKFAKMKETLISENVEFPSVYKKKEDRPSYIKLDDDKR